MRTALAAVMSLLISTGVASGQTPITYTQGDRAIFSVEVPDFWVARTGGSRVFEDPEFAGAARVSRVIALEPETSDTAWVGMISPEGISTLDEADFYVTNVGQFLVESPSRTGEFERRIGGMPARVINGVGQREGRPLRFSVVLTDLPGSRIAILVALAANDAPSGVIDEINAIAESLRAR